MKDHITHVMQNVPKLANDGSKALIAWDVVNEAIKDWPPSTMYKPNVWYNHIPDYVEKAFQFAQEVDPSVLAFYNDYNLLSETKSDKVVKMVKDMQKKNIKIDGIGMQSHHWTSDTDANREYIDKIIKKFGALGL